MNLNKLVSPSTSDEAASNLEEVKKSLNEAQNKVEALREARDDLLLAGDNTALAKHDEKAAAIQIEADRLEAAKRKLEVLKSSLAEKERDEIVNSAIKAAKAAEKRGQELIAGYDKRAREIVEILDELDSINEEIIHNMRIVEHQGSQLPSIRLHRAPGTDTVDPTRSGWRKKTQLLDVYSGMPLWPR